MKNELPEAAGDHTPLPPVSTFIVKAIIRTALLVVGLVYLASYGPLRAEGADMWWWPPAVLLSAFGTHPALGAAGLAGVGMLIIGSYLRERTRK